MPTGGALVLAASLAVLSSQAVEPPQRFRSATELVTVDVLVTDDRRTVTGLTAADFDLFDNGVRQSIEQVYLEQLPVTVVMVLDTSGSVQGPRLHALKAGALSIVSRLRSGDRAAVVSFSHRLTLPAAISGDKARLRAAIERLTADGSTSLRDAAFAGLTLQAADNARTLLLLFSDGVDTSSILDEERVMAIASRSEAIVYAIGVREPTLFIGPGRMTKPAITDDRFLSRLARETGGRLLHAEQPRDIETTFTRVLDEFNRRYVLGYAPRGVDARGWHKLEVRLKGKRGSVLARRGYFAGGE